MQHKQMIPALILAVLLSGCARMSAASQPQTTTPSQTESPPQTSMSTSTSPPTSIPETTVIPTGWQTMDGQVFYLDTTGQPLLGWQEIDGKTHYFRTENGEMVTGWLTLDGDRYYFQENGAMSVGEVEIDGVSNFFTSKGKYVVMVNQWHLMPDDYTLDFAEVEGFQFQSYAADDLKALLKACRSAGYNCTINNTYRSTAQQQYMWDVRIERRMNQGMTREEAIAYTARSLAFVGASEHHLGLAVDINTDPQIIAWMAEHCWEYGFILRYPDNRFDVTGIIYEPWHFRHVGQELALELRDSGLCMEEYMAKLTTA